MASFTEKATLDVVDQATGDIKKINRELQQLFRTASKFKTLTGRTMFNVNTRQLQTANRQLQQFTRQVAAARAAAARPINLRGRSMFSLGGAQLWGRTAAVAFGTVIGTTAAAIGRKIGMAVVEGGRAQDIAQTRLALLGMTPAEQKDVNRAIESIISEQRNLPGGATLNRAQIEQLMAETLPSTVNAEGRFSADAAKFMVDQTNSLIELQISTGIAAKDAVSRAQDFIKAGFASGRLTDVATGVFDPKKAEAFFNTLRRLQPAIGQEFTGEFVRTMLRNAPTIKFGVDDKALAKIMLVGEEERTKIVTGLETLGNALFTTVRKPSSAAGQALRAAGFRTEDMGAVRSVQREFFRDPFSVVDEVIKYMRSVGLDPNKPEDVILTSRQLTGTARAAGALSTMVLQAQELNNQFQSLDRNTGTVAEAQRRTADSIVLSAAKLNNSFEGLAGQTIRVAEPLMRPVMEGLTDTFSALSDSIARGEAPDFTKVMADLSKAAPQMAAMSVGMKALAASGALTGVGITSGFIAMMDPATRPLGAAGVALSGSAAELSTAAEALTAAAVVQGAGGLAGAGRGMGFLGRLGILGAGIASLFGLKKAMETDAARPGGGLVSIMHDFFNEVKKIRADREDEKVAQANVAAVAAQKAIQASQAGEDRATRAMVARTAKSTPEQLAAFERKGITRRELQRRAEEQFGGREGIKQLQAQVGAFVDGLFGPQTLDMVRKHAIERIDKLAARRDELPPYKQPHGEVGGHIATGPIPLDPGIKAAVDMAIARETDEMRRIMILEQQDRMRRRTEEGAAAGTLGGMVMTGGELTPIQRAFDMGTDKIMAAGAGAAESISSSLTAGGTSAAASIASSMISAAAQAGQIIASSVRTAAANISVNVKQAASDTGAQAVTP